MIDDDVLDDDVLDTVKDSLSGVHMTTPVETIVSIGRSRRRRRLSGMAAAGLAVAGLAVGAGLALGVPDAGRAGSTPSSGSANPMQLAAFTVVSSPDGTATVTLLKGPSLNAEALRDALANAGVPALIKVGSFCRSERGNTAGLDQVLSSQRRDDGTVVLVINPLAMPAGAELSIGFKPESVPGTKDRIRFTLVTTGAPLSCSSFR